MASLNDLYSSLFEQVTGDDLQSQYYYLSVVETQRKIPVDYLLSQGVLFIPNNDYIHHYLGDEVLHSNVGFYYQDRCLWTLFVVIPVRNFMGEVVGLVGWDAYNKYQEVAGKEEGLVKYRVSAKSVFQREKYFLTDIECLKREFSHRVIFVTDGVFDAVSLNYRGLPAIALLGSTFSREVIYFLSWYKYIYVCCDNDTAGLSLYKKLAKSVRNVYCVLQAKTKDIEELLREDGVDGKVTAQLRGLLENPLTENLTLTL